MRNEWKSQIILTCDVESSDSLEIDAFANKELLIEVFSDEDTVSTLSISSEDTAKLRDFLIEITK